VEKTHSDGAGVAGIERYFRASLDKYGKLVSLTFHQSRGFSNSPVSGSHNFMPFAGLYN
jgi:hypothetical protein